MSVSSDVLDYVKSQQSPVTSNDLVAAFPALTITQASFNLGDLYRRGKLHRRVTVKSASNQPRYGYFHQSDVASTQSDVTLAPKKESVKAGSLDSMIDQWASAMVDAVVGQVTAKLQAQIESRLREELPRLLPALPAPVNNVVEKDEPRKKKACIVGLLPNQSGLIQQEFESCDDLYFWNCNTGSGYGQLHKYASQCDVFFLAIGHISHKATNILKPVHHKVINVPGGMTQMRESLHKHLAEETA